MGDTMKFKSFEDFKQFAEEKDFSQTLPVGSGHDHSRAFLQIGTVQILIDTVVPYNWYKPTREWYWTGEGFPSKVASELAVKYNAVVEDAYYAEDEDEKQLIFDSWDNILKYVWETRKDELEVECNKAESV